MALLELSFVSWVEGSSFGASENDYPEWTPARLMVAGGGKGWGVDTGPCCVQ